MILVSNAERNAITAKLRTVKFASTKRRIFMEERPEAVAMLKKLRRETLTHVDGKCPT